MTCLCETPLETNGEDCQVKNEASTWSFLQVQQYWAVQGTAGVNGRSKGPRQESVKLQMRIYCSFLSIHSVIDINCPFLKKLLYFCNFSHLTNSESTINTVVTDLAKSGNAFF